jgi:protein O-GlcNAc transferase
MGRERVAVPDLRAHMNRHQRRAAAKLGNGASGSAGQPKADELVAAGVGHHQAGRLPEAEKNYRLALDLQPDQPDALHLLGVLAIQVGRHDAAVELIGRAIQHNGNHPGYYCNHALALQHQGRFDEALNSLDAALALQPGHIEAVHNRGNVLLKLNRPGEALASYDRVIALKPGLAEAFNNRGVVLKELGRLDDALESHDRALALKPDYADALHSRGSVLQVLNRFDEALGSYQRAIVLNPALAEAHNNSGAILRELKRFDEALAAFERASALKPDLAEVWLDRGNVCSALGRHAEAIAAYDSALRIDPVLAGAWLGRGNVLCRLERHDEALASLDSAMSLDPELAAIWLGRGNVLSAQKRQDAALAAYDRALALDHDMAGAWLGRGNVFRELRRPDDAIAAYDEALARDPGLAQAHLGRGNVFSELKRHDEALAAYGDALALEPDIAEAWLGCGNVLRDKKRHDEALAAYDRALRLSPHLPGVEGARLQAKLRVCNWDDFEAERAHLISSLRQRRVVQPFDFLSVSSSSEDQYSCARLFSERSWPQADEEPEFRARPAHNRIRVAYLSADFRQHPMSFLMADIFEGHDRSRFDMTAVSIGQDDGSPMRQRLMTSFEHFIDARTWTDGQIVKWLEDSQTDILVDLMGFTKGARTGVVARRPAPIQVNYLGFPGTLGMRQIDYIIADRVVIPDGECEFFSEKIVYLPFTYYPNGRERGEHRDVPRVDAGLPPDAFVFCCFNNSFKILPDIFDAWMRILKQVERSVLWLLEDNEMASANLRKEAVARGVAAERLIFAKRVLPAEHLARHRCADLFLDTLPYNAHTTASDALREGLPVVTCVGQTFAGRVAASLLTALQMPELITGTLQDYENLAIELAQVPEKLAGTKRKLSNNRLATPAFDSELFTRHIEAAYALMYRRHQAGLAPDHIMVPSDLGGAGEFSPSR